MEMNFLILALAALVPLVMGFIWYGPMLFQKAWMKQMGFTEESMKGSNMGLIFFLSYVFSFMLAFFVQFIVIHQMGAYSSMLESGATELAGASLADFEAFMAKYGANYRTFKHGVLHGVLAGIGLVLPVLATQAMFEKKTVKYVAINAGYWIVTIALMGGIICQWG
ncbi:DUF1761 domain-containing protein [Flavobacteriaceae bacterium S356]|uniref:DUF1761 domain-containing protein n=1 Tax=Asprobacillus argus TaxID=3076534 RepID=A0ABU3LD77_9FLAO|nr:DUF1761 domain-containing protein [Flavobacteriaceae bacterium S356]